jgi:thymidine phosphorylase
VELDSRERLQVRIVWLPPQTGPLGSTLATMRGSVVLDRVRTAARSGQLTIQHHDAIIGAATQDEFDDSDIADLAQILAGSGQGLHRPGASFDLASTGGPGSLSTLIGPLCLRAVGCEVRSLGVPGRPAGGVDVLAQLSDYRLDLSPAEADGVLSRAGYVHLLANSTWTPMDGSLFERRQACGAQACPPLVISSLLSKKLALGVTVVGLDVRVGPHGNFGADVAEVTANTDRFVHVANLLGIDARVYISESALPEQPYIGRGEALLALHEILYGRPGAWLGSHLERIWSITQQLAGAPDEWQPPIQLLRQAWEANLMAQSSGPTSFERSLAEIRSQPTATVSAPGSGRLQVDLGALRATIVAEQRRSASEGAPFADPIGVTLLCRPGSPVERGVHVAVVRLSADVSAIPTTALNAFTVIVPEAKSCRAAG